MPGVDDAIQLAKDMVAQFPQRGDVMDLTAYIRAVSETFHVYPKHYGPEVVKALVAKSKFLPSVAEVREALEEKAIRKRRTEFMARAALKELDRRSEAQRNKTGNTEEQRRRQVEQLMPGFLAAVAETEANDRLLRSRRVPSDVERRYDEIARKARERGNE